MEHSKLRFWGGLETNDDCWWSKSFDKKAVWGVRSLDSWVDWRQVIIVGRFGMLTRPGGLNSRVG